MNAKKNCVRDEMYAKTNCVKHEMTYECKEKLCKTWNELWMQIKIV